MPAYPPRASRADARLDGIARDCEASVVLTTPKVHRNVERYATHTPCLRGLDWIDTTAVPAFDPGARVFHQKFGYGTVTAVEGDKLAIDFEKAGPKNVIARFVTAADSVLVETHAAGGKSVDRPEPVRRLLAQCHERVDGTGTPNGLESAWYCPETEAKKLARPGTIGPPSESEPRLYP